VRIFGPDIARSSPGEPPLGVGRTNASWITDELVDFV